MLLPLASTYHLNLRTWPKYGRGETACQIVWTARETGYAISWVWLVYLTLRQKLSIAPDLSHACRYFWPIVYEVLRAWHDSIIHVWWPDVTWSLVLWSGGLWSVVRKPCPQMAHITTIIGLCIVSVSWYRVWETLFVRERACVCEFSVECYTVRAYFVREFDAICRRRIYFSTICQSVLKVSRDLRWPRVVTCVLTGREVKCVRPCSSALSLAISLPSMYSR